MLDTGLTSPGDAGDGIKPIHFALSITSLGVLVL